jgi:hypothetical protein
MNEEQNQLAKSETGKPQVITPLVDLVSGYITARDQIKRYDEEYDNKVGHIKEARDFFKAEIVKVFKERQEFSTRVQGATVSLSVRRTPKIIDEPACWCQRCRLTGWLVWPILRALSP